ncbi:hypothetical protein K491DRAFT_694800 [Lophiostoma macrostomum CBS 122681]|uniref:ABM domain-containing protein n=1 Tax=Lophiostoma macrostomum CBS 122681 TaxID=1314788 RepID=A0A6A6T258_9PLEO|nr:hypothetical protein K491DRAFT_694800 [Lophiostoma macrostomum CBS 122681]
MSDASTNPPSWSGPGVVQTFITIPPSSQLDQETLSKWLDEVYLPAVIDTGVVKSAWRFKAANPDHGKQNLVFLKVPDLAPVQAGKLQAISRTSDMFPSSESIDAFVESESGIFSFVQLYETTKQPEDAGSVIVYAGMEPKPGGEADLDAWYREEHNQQMSEQPGWKRTTRFSLLFQHRPDGKEMERISFLAIHEFGDGHKIGKNVETLDPMTDWTKKVMSEAKAIDAAIYHKVKTFGTAA